MEGATKVAAKVLEPIASVNSNSFRTDSDLGEARNNETD